LAYRFRVAFEREYSTDGKIEFLPGGGFKVMESLIGNNQTVILDAIITHQHSVGIVDYFKPEEMLNLTSGSLCSAHDTSLQVPIQVSHVPGAFLLEDMALGIESDKALESSETTNTSITVVMPEAIQFIKFLLLESYQAQILDFDNQNN
jgi:Ni,Fe-hydrogenase maturation factor